MSADSELKEAIDVAVDAAVASAEAIRKSQHTITRAQIASRIAAGFYANPSTDLTDPDQLQLHAENALKCAEFLMTSTVSRVAPCEEEPPPPRLHLPS